MPSAYYNTTVRVVANNATAINSEISTQNAADFVLSFIQFDGSNAILLFTKQDTSLVAVVPQKVNLVTVGQVAIDADIATEDGNDFIPTGIFADGSGSVYIVYTELLGGGA